MVEEKTLMIINPDNNDVFKKKKYICSGCGKIYKLLKVEYDTNRKCPKCGEMLVPLKLDPKVY